MFYKIVTPEIRWSRFYVEADSIEEALEKFADGEVDYDGDEEATETIPPTDDQPWYINDEPYTGDA